jgi:mRNA interferase MazF
MNPRRGEVWWVDLDDPVGSGPGFRRPAVVVSNDAFNRSLIATVVVVPLTTNLALEDEPGTAPIRSKGTGLPKASIANASQIVAIDKELLSEPLGKVSAAELAALTRAIRAVLAL